MDLLNILRKDLFQAKKDSDAIANGILSIVIANIGNAKIEKGSELTNEEIEALIRKEIKKLNDAIEQFSMGGREDLANKNRQELKVIQGYVSELMSLDDIKKEVVGVLEGKDSILPNEIGRYMGIVMTKLKGRADGSDVSKVLREFVK